MKDYPTTKDEWFEFAARVLPELPVYASNWNIHFDAAKANELLKARDGHKLADMFDKLWSDLPDSPSIRFQPFFTLCDLCSERPVLDDN